LNHTQKRDLCAILQFFNSPIARWIAIESHTKKIRFIPYHDMELRKLEMSTSFKFFAIQAILLQLLEELLLVWKGVKESKIGCHNGPRPSPFRYVSPGGMDYSRTFESQPWHSELGCAIFTFWFSWKCSKYYFVHGQRSHEKKKLLKFFFHIYIYIYISFCMLKSFFFFFEKFIFPWLSHYGPLQRLCDLSNSDQFQPSCANWDHYKK
jgi:hypothetical protein